MNWHQKHHGGPIERKFLEPDPLESVGRRSSRIASLGRVIRDAETTGIAPKFSAEARSKWAEERESIALERLFSVTP